MQTVIGSYFLGCMTFILMLVHLPVIIKVAVYLHICSHRSVLYSVFSLKVYCKTLIFRCILISRFWSLENSWHFNFAFLLLPSSPLNFLLSTLFRYGFNTPNLIATLFNSFSLSGSGRPKTLSFFHQRRLFTFTMIFYADEILVMGIV